MATKVDVIGQYTRFSLTRHGDSGRAAIADSIHVKLRENNLLGARHIRYGGYGDIIVLRQLLPVLPERV